MNGSAATAPSSSRPEIEKKGLGETTISTLLPQRRQRLRNIVIGAVSACLLILVAAGITRVSHASSEPSYPIAPPTYASPSPPPAEVVAPPPESAISPPTTGTLRLERNLVPRWVFLDGRKLGKRTEIATCGPHQIKVGRGHPLPIDVPCGGELKISR
jgi:hypothetical protein